MGIKSHFMHDCITYNALDTFPNNPIFMVLLHEGGFEKHQISDNTKTGSVFQSQPKVMIAMLCVTSIHKRLMLLADNMHMIPVGDMSSIRLTAACQGF